MDTKVKEHALCCIESSLNRDVLLLEYELTKDDEILLYSATLKRLKYLIEENPVEMFDD